MYINESDKQQLTKLYKDFLNKITEDLSNSSLDEIISFIRSILLFNQSDITLFNLPSEGILALCDIQVCRTTNTLLYDILKSLNIPCKLQYILIDKKSSIWHRVPLNEANHVIVVATINGEQYNLDLFNDIYFTEENGNVHVFNLDKNKTINAKPYYEIVLQLQEIIYKYQHYHSLGIKHVYDYNN